MTSAVNARRARLAARLREVRATAFRSGNAFARKLGWVQSRVSKLETGAQLPTEQDIREWVQATTAGPAVEVELFELLAAARVEYANARDIQRSGGLAARQAALGELEAAATRLAEYQPAIIPALVQTPAYARELLSLPGGPLTHGATEADLEALVAERVRRQQALYQPGKQVQLVIGEAALHSPPRTVATLRGQLDRLLTVAGLTGLDLAVLALQTPMPALPMGGFALLDDRVALIETLTGEQRLETPDEVEVYRLAFEQLRGAAATGDEAAAVIRAAFDGLPTSP